MSRSRQWRRDLLVLLARRTRPCGGSRCRSCGPRACRVRCSTDRGGTHFSGVRFWNFTASAPASTAPSIMRLASSSEPLWLMPISAITKTGKALHPRSCCRSGWPAVSLGLFVMSGSSFPSVAADSRASRKSRINSANSRKAPAAARRASSRSGPARCTAGSASRGRRRPGRRGAIARSSRQVVDVVAHVGQLGWLSSPRSASSCSQAALVAHAGVDRDAQLRGAPARRWASARG